MKLVISEEDIGKRVRELGREISRDYEGASLVVVGVLNGAFIFTADLVRALSVPVEVDFIRVASYGDKTCTSGEVRLTKDVELSLAGKDVLLVEDIVDTGCTLKRLQEHLGKRHANSVRVCALIDKSERREAAVRIDYAGFEVEEGFLIGYGLDFAEKHRNLPAVYHLLNP
jgi:hypoxanthine phosphoribosyltransferase